MESKRMHTSALCALHSVSAGQASFDGSQRRASVTQARVRPCHANVVHTSQVSRPDYPQREAIYFPGHLPSLSLSLRESWVVGGKPSSESHAINCPEGFSARIAMAPGKAPSRTQQMCRCMRENAISRSKCGAEAPRALVAVQIYPTFQCISIFWTGSA